MQFAVNEWVLGSSPRGDANGVLVELVQCRLVTAKVTGSSPVCSALIKFIDSFAGVAQLAERDLAKVEVESSNLFSRSNAEIA